jgi:hypothetical protein
MTVDKYLSVLTAALTGWEDDITDAIDQLTPKERKRLLNAMNLVRLMTEYRETRDRRNG